MATDGDRLLRIYMTDQLALGVLWREIARRARNSSNGTPEGAALERVAAGIGEDVALFEQMMRRLGFSTRTPKALLAVVAERVGRLKRLIERARSQRAELEPFHAQAAQAALR